MSDSYVNNLIFDTSDPNFDFDKFTHLQQFITVSHKLFPHISIDVKKAINVLHLAFESVKAQYSIQDAVTWAKDFQFPQYEKFDTWRLQHRFKYDLVKLIKWKQTRHEHSRMNEERLIRLWDSSDPDYRLLLEIARDGVKVMTAKEFTPKLTGHTDFSPNYILACNAVNKSLYDSFNKDLGVIVHIDTLSLVDLLIHFSRLGLTLKKGKPQGRITCNYSYGKPPHVLNTDEVREMARNYYGDITLPTVYDLAGMILLQCDRVRSMGRSLQDLILWKKDLKGAFTLLFFKPDDCCLLALPMTNGLVYIPIAGNFGLTQFPFVFCVISRSLERRIRQFIAGSVHVYIDDFLGCCFNNEVDDDMQIATSKIEDLLGSDAVEHDKNNERTSN